jgi:LysM repeat protein
MRRRLSSIGIFVLVAVVILTGVTGCERKAQQRVPESTSVAESTPASVTPASPGGVEATPIPGETVVSAVTSTPGAVASPTLVPIGGTPATEQPAETEVAASPTQTPSGSSAPATVVPEAGAMYHTVQRGETLSSIAQRYGTTWQAIANANGLVNPNQIYVGQKLKIPTSSGGSTGGTTGCRVKHTVQVGEWIWQIARDYGVSPYDILAANGLTIQTANTIYPGRVLCIP